MSRVQYFTHHVDLAFLNFFSMGWELSPRLSHSPGTKCVDIQGFPIPQEQRGLEAEYILKRCKAGGGLSDGVLEVLCQGEELVLGVLVAMTEGS